MEKQRRLNLWLLGAAVIMSLTVLIHVFAGGPEIYDPLRAASLDPVVESVLSVVWHAITLLLTLFAAALFWLSRERNQPLWWMVMGSMLGFSGLFIAYGMIDLGTLWPMPQWVIFLAVAGLMVGGARRA